MTRLLVSVRNAQEAQIALEAGVDLIDVKEPRHGSLGAADPATMLQIAHQVAGRTTLSAALGELKEIQQNGLPEELPDGYQYAKLGLSGCSSLPQWKDRWETLLKTFPPTVEPVAVVYADWEWAAAPAPEEVIEVGTKIGCRVVLVDTFEKTQGKLLDHLTLKSVASLLRSIKTHGMLTVLAGSLNTDSIEKILPLAPDYIAVRGAVCRGDRTQAIDRSLVQELVQYLRKTTSKICGKIGCR